MYRRVPPFKAALNALTRLTAGTAARGVSVNAVCPGWIQTDMGYQDGNPPRTVQEGADTIVWLATQEDPPTNGFGRIACSSVGKSPTGVV